jgi:hypothetical protein
LRPLCPELVKTLLDRALEEPVVKPERDDSEDNHEQEGNCDPEGNRIDSDKFHDDLPGRSTWHLQFCR